MSVFTKDKSDFFKDTLAGEDQLEFDSNQFYYGRDNVDSLQQHHQVQNNGYNLGSFGGQSVSQLLQQQQQQTRNQLGQLQQQSNLSRLHAGSNIGNQDGLQFGNSMSSTSRLGSSYGTPQNTGLNFSNSNLNMYGNVGSRSVGDIGSSTLGGSRGLEAPSPSYPVLGGVGTNSSLLRDGNSSFGSAIGQLHSQNQPSGLGSLRMGSTAVNPSDEDFTIESEDFPALPSGHSKSVGSGHHQSDSSGNLSQNAFNQGSGAGDGSSSGLLVTLGPSGSASASSPLPSNKEVKYGMGGLLDVIRLTDKDVNTLALGIDLTAFGLNLNAVESLYPLFVSPFTEGSGAPEPTFSTPQCYMMHPPSLKSEHLSKFQIETLFYMFYAMPRDILQSCAAQELYRREWRYHGELRLWLRSRTSQEIMHSHPSVPFVYFDCNAWETRLFNNAQRANIAQGVLSEEEIRVKASTGVAAGGI